MNTESMTSATEASVASAVANTGSAAPVEKSTIADDLSKAYDETQATEATLEPQGKDEGLRKDIQRAIEGDVEKPAPVQKVQDDGEAHRTLAKAREEAVKQGDYAMVDALDVLRFKSNLSQVQHFASEKDAGGEVLRPHFEEVAGDIIGMLNAANEEGRTLTLAQAYDSAVWANPATRAKMEAAKRDAEKSKTVTREPKKRESTIGEDLAAVMAAAGR